MVSQSTSPSNSSITKMAPLSCQNPVKAAVGGIGLFGLVYSLGSESFAVSDNGGDHGIGTDFGGVLLPRLFQCIGQCRDFQGNIPVGSNFFVQFRLRFQQPSSSPFPLKPAEVFRQFVLDLLQWLYQLFRNGTGQRLWCRLVQEVEQPLLEFRQSGAAAGSHAHHGNAQQLFQFAAGQW